ncbi:hypothetical protein FHG87_005205 [Trinorchestia longiramus]|nr:hypothetical protein FHG87_005205 [Trinorchestia longiramus]
MQREERHLEVAVDAVLQRVTDLKQSLAQLLQKLEQEGESADWPDYLQQYSVISGQMFTLLKVLRNEKTPPLRSYLTLPLQLNADPDELLLRMTETRVPAFSHDFVPNLLRTKPDPELELKYHQLNAKMNIMNSDTSSKQINLHNKVVKHIVEMVSSARDEWETETSRSSLPQTCSLNETHSLLAAVGTGKGLRPTPITSPMGGAGNMAAQQQTQNSGNKRSQQHQGERFQLAFSRTYLTRINLHIFHNTYANRTCCVQMFTLLKVLRNEKTPPLRSYLTLPLQLNADPDELLLRMTETRVPAFSHDFVPNLLRTKPDPELELKYHQLNAKMNIMNSDTSSKQINLHNKVVKHIVEMVSSARDEWETETSRSSLPQTCSLNETHSLLAAVGTGKGLRPTPITSPMGGAGNMAAQQQTQNSGNKRSQQHQGKAPSAIKTNIKAAGQMHPYRQ